MRRIYESNALDRDDESPFQPNERRKTKPRAMRTVPAATLSKHLVPHWVRHRAISIDIRASKSSYEQGESVPFEVNMKNHLPIPIVLSVNSPVVWNWTVNGHREGSRIQVDDIPERLTQFTFDRGEQKRFLRQWHQKFRTGTHEWSPVSPGTYTIGAQITVDNPDQKGLSAETTVRVED